MPSSNRLPTIWYALCFIAHQSSQRLWSAFFSRERCPLQWPRSFSDRSRNPSSGSLHQKDRSPRSLENKEKQPLALCLRIQTTSCCPRKRTKTEVSRKKRRSAVLEIGICASSLVQITPKLVIFTLPLRRRDTTTYIGV